MKTARYLLLLLAILAFAAPLQAQYFDDFSDGDFLNNPAWSGNHEHFIVNKNNQLQLNAQEAGEAFLFLPAFYENQTVEWRFTIRLAFSPSDNNYARIYLAANQSNLESSDLEAFYLQFGENGSNDAIELYYRQGENHQLLCRGKAGLVASSFNYNIKVIKDESNQWEILVDNELNGNYQPDSRTAFPIMESKAFFGIYCHYTSSNSTNFYFDNIYVGQPAIDTVKPYVELVQCFENGVSMLICFSENITPETALNTNNYVIESVGTPQNCQFETGRYNRVIIEYQGAFELERKYLLTISGVMDNAKNVMVTEQREVVFYQIKRNDVLIYEIMADPTPAVRLPEYEYIELYNRTDKELFLQGWKLQTGRYVRDLPDILLQEKGMAVIVASANLEAFSGFPNVYGISSLSITDGGQAITLYHSNGAVIHHVVFQQRWHTQSIKKSGGWSLEMIDANNPCTGENNWSSSTAPQGGTPGRENSVSASNPDISPPEIERITLEDSATIQLFFTESLLLENDMPPDLFSIDRGISILSVEDIPPESRSARIALATPLQRNCLYTLTVKKPCFDCVGNAVPMYSSISFGIPQQALPSDLVINEILTSLGSGKQGNFIEIYNRSDKIIDMKDILIGAGGDAIPEKATTAISGGCQLLPKQYIVLCENKDVTMKNFTVPYPNRLLTCDSLPSYAKSKGTVHLTDCSYNPIDKLVYNDKMHYSMLKSIDGVSLERVHFDLPTQDAATWKSAAESVGFATPGYQNSQFTKMDNSTEIFSIYPEVFSPNGDGFNDYTLLSCQFPEGESRVTVTVFDLQGQKIKMIANNEYCGTASQFQWDGICDKGYIAPPGLYVIQLEYWNLLGNKKSIRKVVGVR